MNDLFTDSYDLLMKSAGMGDKTTYFIVSGEDTFQKIYNMNETKEYLEGYAFPFLRNSGLSGKAAYAYRFVYNYIDKTDLHTKWSRAKRADDRARTER